MDEGIIFLAHGSTPMQRFLGLSEGGGFNGGGWGIHDSMEVKDLTWFENITLKACGYRMVRDYGIMRLYCWNKWLRVIDIN